MNSVDEYVTAEIVEAAARGTIDRHAAGRYVPERCFPCRDAAPGECRQLAWAEDTLPEYRPSWT